MLKIGIEQEFVFADGSGQYIDAESTPYSVFSNIIEQFPAHEGDNAVLDCKSLERYPKRCYVEGFERHDANGNVIETLPKGLEIRTMPHESVDALVEEFRETYSQMVQLAAEAAMRPVLTSRHPFKTALNLGEMLSEDERRVRTASRLELARNAMLTHGLHVNVSVEGHSPEEMQDLVEKVNYYTPSLVCWSYSSPFYNGDVFEGLCARNYFRAGSRSMADLNQRQNISVLEFRGFDACGDTALLTAILELFSGFVLDRSLPGRASEQDADRLMRSSLNGFADPQFRSDGRALLKAAKAALGTDSDSLGLLEGLLESNDSASAQMKACYEKTGSIMDCISGRYDF